jgi:hypothetical protein
MNNTNRFLLKWIVFVGIGEFFGIACAAGIALSSDKLFGEPVTLPAILQHLSGAILSGIIEGGITGYLMWWVLRLRYPNLTAFRWVGATILGAVIAWLLGSVPRIIFAGTPQVPSETPAYDPPAWIMALGGLVMGLVLGLLLGWTQYLALRNVADKRNLWIWANALGWAGGMFFIFLAAGSVEADTPLWFTISLAGLSGITAGLFVGWVTGLFLLKMKPLAS